MDTLNEQNSPLDTGIDQKDKSAQGSVSFYQGGEPITQNNTLKTDLINLIKNKLAEFFSVKNVNFLLGAGVSAPAIPTMKELKKMIVDEINNDQRTSVKELFEKVDSNEEKNLEQILSTLYAKKVYLDDIQTKETDEELVATNELISLIEKSIYQNINIDFSADEAQKTMNLYLRFYQKIALRNKDLSRLHIFTTNCDLMNEKILDQLNIDFNNGFGGGLDRVFNPARFNYTFSKRIDMNLEKFEPLDNMVYLYKLHGSISWVHREQTDPFNIFEIPVEGGKPNNNSHVLIYPTPLKQQYSLGSPYSDLMREFQTRLSLSHSILFIIGYSFSDEHLNRIIYRSLLSNSSLTIVIFGEYKNEPLAKSTDSRIYQIYSSKDDKPIHHFEYIVNELLPIVDENIDTNIIKKFATELKPFLIGPKNENRENHKH